MSDDETRKKRVLEGTVFEIDMKEKKKNLSNYKMKIFNLEIPNNLQTFTSNFFNFLLLCVACIVLW